jgi:putative heme-binding domain-containing protein
MQIPIIRALAAQGLDRDFEALAQRWHLWGPPQQLATINALIEFEGGARALLSAIDNATIPREALTSVHVNVLRHYPVDDVMRRARLLFGEADPDRDEIVGGFLEATELHGSRLRGRDLFQRRCYYCHGHGTLGAGPPLKALQDSSPLQLVASLVDPSREVSDENRTIILRLSNGRTAWGVARRTEGQVTVVGTPDGVRRFNRDAIKFAEGHDWSVMPTDIGAGLTRQDVADIIRFIREGNPTKGGRH